jgi:hypothetical protein
LFCASGTPSNSLLATVPHAEMVVWADVGHSADLEQPERYAELVLTWLRRIGFLPDGNCEQAGAAVLRSKY